MFDILPEKMTPRKKTVCKEIAKAIEQSQSVFKALPGSFARSSVLSSLGRVGKPSLRDKINHRASILMKQAPGRFAGLEIVCHQAVLGRNHYVHGSDAGFDYQKEFQAFAFLIDSLEFIFAASDLIELGWDFKQWLSKGTTMSHPFGVYTINFDEDIRALKELVRKSPPKQKSEP